MSSRGVYGPGTFTDDKFTPVPLECKRILKLLVKATPGFTQDVAVLDSVSFVGGDYPIIPGPIKSQAVTAVIHAMAGIVGQEILELRGQKRSALTINTDQAGLYLASPVTFSVDGRDAVQLIESGQLDKLAPDTMNGAVEGPLKYRAMAIYPTKNPGEWYQWHGSNDPNPGLRLLGIDPDARLPSNDAAYELIKSRVSQYSAKELDMMMTEHGLCGCTCYTPEAWRQTSMAKVLARHPLINYKRKLETPDLPPVPFPVTSDKRPLAGIKVVELARIIAAPALGQALAALGAEVIRVQKKSLADLTVSTLFDYPGPLAGGFERCVELYVLTNPRCSCCSLP